MAANTPPPQSKRPRWHTALPPADVLQVLKDQPGISLVRAHQIARDRKLLRQRAERQVRHRRMGEPCWGGISLEDRNLLASFEQAAGCTDFLETFETDLIGRDDLGGLL